MKNLTKFAFALSISASALAGCAADAPTNQDPSDPSDPSDPVDPLLSDDVDLTGKYQIKSNFDLATNAPGTVGDITNTFISMTDDPDDPTNFILDKIIENTSGFIKTALQGAKPFVAGYLNDRLLDFAPDFVSTIIAVGDDFGQIAKNFGLNETLDVVGSEGNWLATHTVTGARFKIDNVESDYPFADYGVAPVAVPGVGLQVESSGKLTLAQHTVGIQYGSVLRIGLDAAIIPSLDPTAANLAQLMQHQIDCQVVGQIVNDAVANATGFSLGAGPFAAGCTLGLQKAADLIYSKIASLDNSALDLGIEGTAKALDTDQNGAIDKIQTGAWVGTASYAGNPAPLAGATFFGTRM